MKNKINDSKIRASQIYWVIVCAVFIITLIKGILYSIVLSNESLRTGPLIIFKILGSDPAFVFAHASTEEFMHHLIFRMTGWYILAGIFGALLIWSTVRTYKLIKINKRKEIDLKEKH